jgi:hypothetical protein
MSKRTHMKKSPSKANLWLGIDFFAWMRLLGRNRFAISFSKLPVALLITATAVSNTCLRWCELLWYGSAVRKIEIPDDPIFILGHWRTGTTMLHELLAVDPRNRCPSTYESLSPNHFLISERFVRRFAWWILPRTRPFDNMRMSFDRPQEDEAALCLLGQPSPFLTVAFPQRPVQDQKYTDLQGLSPRQLSAWKSRLLWFLRMLLFKRPGRLVLKSPQHTFRLPVLIEMFPKAKFIYLVRDPYTVYPSTVHFWKTMYESYGLQPFDVESVREYVLSTFEQMHTRLEATRTLVNPDRFYEMRYELLTANPLEQMELLYDFLDLGDFETVRPALEKYAERSRRYRTNEYDLDAISRDAVSQRWSAYIQKHGYESSKSPISPEASTT